MLVERTLMERTIEVLGRLVAAGIVGPYAIGGAVAAYKYIEAALTEVLDILVSFEGAGGGVPGLIALSPVFQHLAELGYSDFRREGLMIEGWPVQFLPVASELDRDALDTAVVLPQPSGLLGPARVLLPEYLAAIALKVGRPKDMLRVSQFLSEGAVETGKLAALVRRHDLTQAWRTFCLATGTPFDTLDRGGA